MNELIKIGATAIGGENILLHYSRYGKRALDG